MDYSEIIIACYDKLTEAYMQIGKLNQILELNSNSVRMINIHGYSTTRFLISKLTNTKIEMCEAIKSIYKSWSEFQEKEIITYDKYNLYPEKINILDPLIGWKNNKTAIKYKDIDTNGSLIDILNSLTCYTDSLINGALFYAKTISELPLEDVSYIYGEIHLSRILSKKINMPFFPMRACKQDELLTALEKYKEGKIEYWVNFFLSLVITQCKNNVILLYEIENFINDLKEKMKNAGVSHLKINEFCEVLLDNTAVDAKFVSEKTGLVPYRAKVALDIMYENNIVLKSNAKRNTTYFLVDYYRHFLNN